MYKHILFATDLSEDTDYIIKKYRRCAAIAAQSLV